MGFTTIGVIPKDSTEVDASSSNYTCPSHTVGFRVNDITAGSSVRVVTRGGTTVTFDNLKAGEDIVLEIASFVAAGTDCDSVHIFHD